MESSGDLRTFKDDVLVFFDETGHEDLKGEPGVFGYGGIIVDQQEYVRQLMPAWGALKERHGLGAEAFHATDLRGKRGHRVKQDVGQFFKNGAFFRFAAVARKQTILLNENVTYFEAAFCLSFTILNDYLAAWSASRSYSRVVLIFEDSERLRRTRYKDIYGLGIRLSNGGSIPTLWTMLPKVAAEPGLEMADYVANVASKYARLDRSDPGRSSLVPFKDVFEPTFRAIAEYREADSVGKEPALGPPGLIRVGMTK